MTIGTWILSSFLLVSAPADQAQGSADKTPPTASGAQLGTSTAAANERPGLATLALVAGGAGLAAAAGTAVAIAPYLGAVALGSQIRDATGVELFVWQNSMVAVLPGLLVAVPGVAAAASAAIALPLLGFRRGAAVAAGAVWGLTGVGTAAMVPLVLLAAILTDLGVYDGVDPRWQLGAGIGVGALTTMGAGLGALAGALLFPDEWAPEFAVEGSTQ